ncbi:class I adenylate-forming enzyme family protein [Aliirhizobium smilacinae]|uniref:Long-chain fatty acid--CoA ligase n=1 Tax=Aliirhizobium smilacinae TaxID=1395944 RepID=A0A5C4X9R2_9HYPH|nr:AMP-binding protein [Rhizobium smilacinae]TNM60147.1 long-chain fatty acid--CoA ligase [Rhizobium smilacinae]
MNWGRELSAMRDRYGDRVGIVDIEGTHTTASVVDRATGIARRLQDLGLGPGEFVATIFQNSALAAAASYAVALVGSTEVPINPVLSAAEIGHALRCTGTRIILLDGAAKPTVSADVSVEDVRAIAACAFVPEGWPDVVNDEPSRIVFTSGTTGPAKGAIHTHRSRWVASLMLRAALPILPGGDSRILLMTPFSHGSSLLTFAYLAEGASVHLMQGVDPAVILPLLNEGEVTEMFAPPTVLAKLTEALGRSGHAGLTPKLKTILTGTAPLSPTLYRNVVNAFGEIVRVTYGKSEIFNPITVLDPAETAAVYAEPPADGLCVGWPASGVEVEIRDDEGKALPHGEIGQIHLASPHMFTGYITANGRRMLAPGEYHDTGDLGRIDDRGRLFLVARDSDMMKSGGYKIAPDEVERALVPALPGTELVALGFPSEYWGEIVTVVAQRPPDGWRDDLMDALSAMTPYKRPRLFVAIDEIPRNAIGKISRAHLRRWLSETYDLVERPHPAFVAKAVVLAENQI